MKRRSVFPGVLWAVPVISLGLTAFAWRAASTTIAARAEERFAFRTDVIESTIRERMRNYEDILRGAAGLFDSSDTVTRTEWQRYMNSIRPGVFGGGVQALGIAVRVPTPSTCRVLVAEDSPINQQVIVAMLRRLGLEPTLVEDGQAAVEATAQRAFDLVLMDCQMPIMDGFEATREIRARGSNGRPWIVAVTANAMAGDAERCRAAGMDDYVSKPISIDALRRVAAPWLNDSAA